MDKKNGSGKRTLKDLTLRGKHDVTGGLFTTQVKEAFAKAAAPVLGNTWGNTPGGRLPGLGRHVGRQRLSQRQHLVSA
jgi:hypothetical protein